MSVILVNARPEEKAPSKAGRALDLLTFYQRGMDERTSAQSVGSRGTVHGLNFRKEMDK